MEEDSLSLPLELVIDVPLPSPPSITARSVSSQTSTVSTFDLDNDNKIRKDNINTTENINKDTNNKNEDINTIKMINDMNKKNIHATRISYSDMISNFDGSIESKSNYGHGDDSMTAEDLLFRRRKLVGRPHFYASKRSSFPQWLLHHAYYARDFPMRPLGFSIYPIEGFKRHLYEYDDLGRSQLVYDPRFVIGESVRSLDLRYWVDLKSVVKYIEEQKITSIQELLLNEHLEATSAFLLQLSKSPYLSKSLIALNLGKCNTIDSKALDTLGRIKTIKMLVVSDVHAVTEKSIESLCSSLENMTALDISGCKSVSDGTLKLLAQTMRFRLISLAAGRNDNITHIGVNEIVLLCENLKHLDLSNCPKLDFMGVVIRHISGELQHGSRNLMRICIDNNKDMNMHALDWICAANPDLEVVSLMNIQSVTSGIVLGLAMGCKRLNTLNISRCVQVGPAALMSMDSCGKSLTDLNISHIGTITSEALSSLLVNCPSLAILDCSGNKGINDAAFADIEIIDDLDDTFSQVGSVQSKYSTKSINLRRLSVSRTSITSFGVACLAERCRQLRHLNISYLRHVTDAAVSVIAGCCKHLREFYADDCLGLTDRSIIEVIYECHQLESLKLSTSKTLLDAWGTRFVQYTDEVLISALDGGHGLIDISLRNQFGITFRDSWFSEKFPFKGHRSLRKIDLRGVDNLYLPNAAKVFRSCYDLNEVYLSDEDSLPGVRSTQFRLDAFECAPYAKVFPDDFDDNLSLSSSIISPNQSPEKSIIGQVQQKHFIALSQHPDAIGWRYRDYYFRRRQLETWAAKTIGFKWRLHYLWNKIRTKIYVRRIEFWYWRWNDFYKRLAALELRVRNRAAKLIQNVFRSILLPKLKAAIRIQTIVRGYFGRKSLPRLKNKIKAAVNIQRIARGMLTRLSDRYILSQIFLKIPPFWRLIMNSAPPASKVKKNKRMFQFQITDLHGATNAMVDYIMEDVARNGILAPHLPMIIPQKFDKDPYVSLSDGRMLTFFSHHDGLLHDDIKNKSKLVEKIEKEKLSRNNDIVEGSLLSEKKQKPQQSVHMFNMTFWPLTEPMEDVDSDTSHFDPMLNNFEVAQNSREVLYCEVCRARLRVVECKTCTKGFCFFCAFRTHTTGGKRGHAMKIVEPRIVKIKEVSKSLVYHVDLAEKYSHDIQYLVKYLRSASEVKRLEQEKRLALEFEQQEEIRRRAFLKAGQESHNKHEAATKISLLYRVAKAKRLVSAKRVQQELERYTVKETALNKQWIPVQKLFRLFSTRNWFAQKGIIWSTSRKKKRKKAKPGKEPKITKEEIRERINYELRQRYTLARLALIESIYVKYAEVQQLLDVNIAFWVKREAEMPIIQERLHEMHVKFMKDHEELSQWTAAQKPLVTPTEYEKLEAALKGVMMQVESADSRHSSLVNLRWWITQHLRGCYRRKATLKMRSNDTLLRLEWIAEEFYIVTRVEFQMRTRIAKMNDVAGMKVPVEWLKAHADLAANHLAALDSQQETILLEELARINREEHATLEFDSLLEELFNGMKAESQYAAERIYLDKATLTAAPGTDDALRWAESLVLLKRKQNQLVTSVIDTLKDGLQKKLDDEDETNQLYYGFPTDDPHLPVSEFHKITAQLLDHFVSHGHFNVIDYISIYMAQPWLADMATADVRFEEQIRSAELQRNKLQTMLDTLKHRIEDGVEKCKDLTTKMQEINQEIDVRQKHLEESGGDETHANIIGALKTEIFKKENEMKLQEEMNVKEQAQEQPLVLEIEKLTLSLADMNERLETRIKERDYLRGRFFDQEAAMEEAIFHECALAAHVVEKQLLASNKQLRYFEQAAKSEEYIDKIVHYDIRIDERNAFAISLGSQKFHIQRCLNILRPRVVNLPNSYIQHYIAIRLESSEVDIRVLKANQIVVSSEEQEVEEFKNKRSGYEKAVQLFTDKLLYQRRQRSIQREINERKERLKELREMRLRLLKEEKARLLALEAEQQAIEAKKKAEYIPISKQLAKIIKKGIRSAKDYIRDWKHGLDVAMSDEEKLMAKAIKSSAAETASRPEAIRRLYVTQGDADMQSFYEQNALLEERGLPFYLRMEKSLGNGIYLWTQSSMDPKQFITGVEFGHKDPTHPKYKDPKQMEKDKYEAIGHDKMNLIIWIKRDVTKIRAICGFQISYSEVDENRNMVDGFEKFEEPLVEYDLPDIYMWKKIIQKISHTDKVPVKKLVGEFQRAVKMAADKPNDKNLQLVVQKMKDEMAKAHKQAEDFEVTNPINKAIDLMALDVNEMERWMHAYERFGAEKFAKNAKEASEKIMTLELVDIAMFIEETPSSFLEHIFKSADAFNEFQEIEFGDFMRAVSTYCFFGKQEILQFLYTFIGKEVEGKIIHEEFISLLNILHPYDKRLAKRALKELNMQPGKIMEFKEFKTLNDAFPAMFYPAFRIQHTFRLKTLGADWFFDKLKKYEGVRTKLVKMTDKIDELAVLEMQRFNVDLEKAKRMAEREKQIKKETSAIRKTILEAKQFLDEFS